MRKNFKFILPLLILLTGGNARGQVKDTYLKGIACSDAGKYERAIEQFERALERDRDNTDFMLGIAEACLKKGDAGSAKNWLSRVETEEPGKGAHMLAGIYASENNPRETVRYLEIHLRSAWKLPSDHILLDNTFSGIEDSREWRELWKGDWYTEEEMFIQEVRYLASSGEHLQCLEEIEEGLKKYGNKAALYALRGRVLLEMNQLQGSIQAYSEAITLDSKESAWYYERAGAYLLDGKNEKAVPDLEKAWKMEPENLGILIETAQVYRDMGDYSSATRNIEQYSSYYPDDAEARHVFGQVLFDSGKYLDALRHFNACLEMNTGDPRYYISRGKTYLQTKTYRYALNDFGMALDLDPSIAEAWYYRGITRRSMNDTEGWKSDFEKAARLGSYEAAKQLEEERIPR